MRLRKNVQINLPTPESECGCRMSFFPQWTGFFLRWQACPWIVGSNLWLACNSLLCGRRQPLTSLQAACGGSTPVESRWLAACMFKGRSVCHHRFFSQHVSSHMRLPPRVAVGLHRGNGNCASRPHIQISLPKFGNMKWALTTPL